MDLVERRGNLFKLELFKLVQLSIFPLIWVEIVHLKVMTA